MGIPAVRIIDLRVALSEFEFSNCTFYNNETGIPKMFRLDKQPKMISLIVFSLVLMEEVKLIQVIVIIPVG